MAGNKTRTNRLTNTDTGRGLWPPAGKGQRGAVAGAMAPAIETGERGLLGTSTPGGNRKRTAFPTPVRDGAP